MIDRNDFDLRIAQHHERVAHIDHHAWRSPAQQHPLRSRLAALLVVLAARVAPWITAPISPVGTALDVQVDLSV